jgi:hypothetical protein
MGWATTAQIAAETDICLYSEIDTVVARRARGWM